MRGTEKYFYSILFDLDQASSKLVASINAQRPRPEVGLGDNYNSVPCSLLKRVMGISTRTEEEEIPGTGTAMYGANGLETVLKINTSWVQGRCASDYYRLSVRR